LGVLPALGWPPFRAATGDLEVAAGYVSSRLMRPIPQKSRSPFAAPRGLCFFDLRQGEGRVASLPWITRNEAAIVAAS